MKILIIEDDERISAATGEILKDNHYLVETAFDGEIGWELAQTMTYDLIILDLMLPKMDG
ncbi:response regulator, partial [Geminocystis sp. GBBB08]|uniref:response regulator n=1 Tax=Geminocystis sp. GBBB08 TaxID=2604140 RepID=UPI0027E24824